MLSVVVIEACTLLDHFRVRSDGDRDRRCGMPQIVEPAPLEACAADGWTEHSAHEVLSQRATFRGREHVPVPARVPPIWPPIMSAMKAGIVIVRWDPDVFGGPS